MFKLPEGVPIIVSADIPSLDNERMEIDPDIWSAVNGEVSVIWVTVASPSSAGLVSISSSNSISESDPDSRAVYCRIIDRNGSSVLPGLRGVSILGTKIFVHKHATIYELKQAICLADPKLLVEGLLVTGLQKASSGHEHTDACRLSATSYSFYYNPSCCAI